MKFIHTMALLFFFFGLFSQEFTLGDPNSPFINHRKVDADFADVDGDGDIDVLILIETDKGPRTGLFLNLGLGKFTESEQVLLQLQESILEFGDIDNDGDLDLFISGVDAQNNRQL